MNAKEACFSLRQNCVEDWWPLPSEGTDAPAQKPRQVGLFLRGQIRRRRAVGKASAKAKAKAKAVKAASANTGKKKVRGKKLKKAKAEVEIESDPKN